MKRLKFLFIIAIALGSFIPNVSAAKKSVTGTVTCNGKGVADVVVTDGVNIQRMTADRNGDKLIWKDDNTNAEKYVALNPKSTGWLQPTKVGRIKNQNLHALQDIDYVIICPEEFKEPAIRLAKKHEEVDNLTWAVVSDEEVYNEFSVKEGAFGVLNEDEFIKSFLKK